MNKGLLEDMLELAKREKARWEKRIQEINAELRTEQRKSDRPKKSKTAQTEKKIIEILENNEKPLSPKDIVEKARESGVELKSNIVRQILSRSKDEKFVSPDRGLWILKGKE